MKEAPTVEALSTGVIINSSKKFYKSKDVPATPIPDQSSFSMPLLIQCRKRFRHLARTIHILKPYAVTSLMNSDLHPAKVVHDACDRIDEHPRVELA